MDDAQKWRLECLRLAQKAHTFFGIVLFKKSIVETAKRYEAFVLNRK